MLESLRQGAGTIHELNLAGAFPARVRYRPREMYEALKATPLFDAERRQWNWSMDEDQTLLSTDRDAPVQLIGVLTEAQCNPEWARMMYQQLKATRLFDAARGQWNVSMSEYQVLKDESRDADAQLLGVLAEAQFAPESVHRLYERLKATPLYDAARGQWNTLMSKRQELEITECYATTQLLGVLVETLVDPERGQVLYEKLKTSPLYDAARGQWNWYMSTNQRPVDTNRFASAQLLGVLAEAQFNPERARVLYEELKATPLYDPERRQWNWNMSEEQILQGRRRLADFQLLGVLVEAKLLATVPRPLTEAVPPLPITEEW